MDPKVLSSILPSSAVPECFCILSGEEEEEEEEERQEGVGRGVGKKRLICPFQIQYPKMGIILYHKY